MSEEDPFESFFNFAKTAKRTINVQGAVDNRVIVEASAPEKVVRRENLGTGYATEFQKTEKVLLANQFLNLPTHAAGTSFDDIDSNFGSDNGDLDKATTEIYNRYSFKMIPREDLPISKAKDLILHEIRNNPVIIITGHTGSGIQLYFAKFRI